MEVGGKQRNYCCSVAKLYPICDSANCGIPGFPVPHRLCELAQIHVHWVGNSTHPSHPLLPLLSSFFPSIEVFPTEAALRIRWPKYRSFSSSPSNEHSWLVSFRINWFELLAVQGTFKSLLKHHNPKASVPQHPGFFRVQLSQPDKTTGKPQLWLWSVKWRPYFLIWVSRFVITFLARSKRLLISRLQSPSTVILESKKIIFATVSTFSPSICHELIGLDAMILVHFTC